MIKFDPTLLHTDIMLVKSCSTSNGGYIQVVDEAATARMKKEIYVNIPVPRWVVFTFIRSNGQTSKFMTARPIKVCFYGDLVIDLEDMQVTKTIVNDDSITVSKSLKTFSSIENAIKRIQELTMKDHEQWYIDGVYIYKFDSNSELKSLSADNKFRCITAIAVDLTRMHLEVTRNGEDPMKPIFRACVGFYASNGMVAISPPEWSSFYNFTSAANKNIGDSDRSYDFPFDVLDEMYGVNINFALRAAKVISTLYDFDAIEPLNLPELMLELNTVNIPNIGADIKSTFDIGLKMSHTMAWLLGLMSKIDNIDEYIEMASVLKTLTGNGIFRKSLVTESAILKQGKDFSDIVVKTIEEAKNTELTIDLHSAAWRVNNARTEEIEGF